MSRRQGGFAYLFLLFTIALLAVSLLAIVTVQRYARVRSDEAELLRIGSEMRAALESYRQHTSQRAYPLSLDDLVEDKRTRPAVRHLRKIYFDPITRKREWGLMKEGGGIVGIHSRSERQPLKLAGFDPEHQGFDGAEQYSDWVFSAVPLSIERPAAGTPAL